MARHVIHPKFPTALMEALLVVAEEMARQSSRLFQVEPKRARRGRTLRPGKETPLWNELRALLRPELLKYGQQVNLGRLLGLPRQRINAFVTGGGQMPDAERTLQLIAWLVAVRKGRRPS
jgi:hypothetical protein